MFLPSRIADTHGVGMDIWVLPPSEIEAALFVSHTRAAEAVAPSCRRF